MKQKRKRKEFLRLVCPKLEQETMYNAIKEKGLSLTTTAPIFLPKCMYIFEVNILFDINDPIQKELIDLQETLIKKFL